MKKRKSLLFFISICVAIFFVGCQNNSNTITVTPSPTPSPSATATATPSPTPSIKSSPTPSTTKKVLAGSGTYNGRVDSNFIEVTLANGEIKSCRLSDKLKESFDKLSFNEGDKITFEYTVLNGQYTIQTIKK